MKNLNMLLNQLKYKIYKQPYKEHGIIGWINTNESYEFISNSLHYIENSGKNFNKLTIDKKLTINLLLISKIHNIIPFIAHTHIFLNDFEKISFSNQDRRFFNSIITFGNKIGLKEYVFILFDGNQYVIEIVRRDKIEEIRGVFDEFNNWK